MLGKIPLWGFHLEHREGAEKGILLLLNAFNMMPLLSSFKQKKFPGILGNGRQFPGTYFLDFTGNGFILKLLDGSETERRSKLKAPLGIALFG